MNEKERKILNSLCNGDISFTEAAEFIGMSKEKVKKMLEGYTWTPSSEKLSELHEIEMETLLYIEEITQVKNKILQTRSKKLDIDMTMATFVVISMKYITEKFGKVPKGKMFIKV